MPKKHFQGQDQHNILGRSNRRTISMWHKDCIMHSKYRCYHSTLKSWFWCGVFFVCLFVFSVFIFLVTLEKISLAKNVLMQELWRLSLSPFNPGVFSPWRWNGFTGHKTYIEVAESAFLSIFSLKKKKQILYVFIFTNVSLTASTL